MIPISLKTRNFILFSFFIFQCCAVNGMGSAILSKIWARISSEVNLSPVVDEENARECPICLKRLGHEKIINTCGGQHVFHRDCFSRWFANQRTCPLDRNEISPDVLREELNSLQKHVRDGLIFSKSFLFGIKIYIMYKQMREEPIWMRLLRRVSDSLIDRMDNQFITSEAQRRLPRNEQPDNIRLRRHIFSSLVMGATTSYLNNSLPSCKQQNLLPLLTLRRSANGIINQIPSRMFPKITRMCDFDYNSAVATDFGVTRGLLYAAGICSGLYAGMRFDNKLQELTNVLLHGYSIPAMNFR